MAGYGLVGATKVGATKARRPKMRAGVAARQEVGRAVRQRRVSGGGQGVGGNMQAGLGQQLSNRVSSGAISQDQAGQVAGERGIFQQAFGKNWRQKVYGDTGYMKKIREQLQAEPDNPQLIALYEQQKQNRASELARAKAKLGM